MKMIKFFSLITFLFFSSSSFSQGINYKAQIKDSNGNLINNQAITIRFTILQGIGESNVYQETHNPTTDTNGIVIVNIGEGSVNSGVFADIDWGSDAHALRTEIDTGDGLTDLGTSTFKSVPYAISALNAASKIDELDDGRADADGSSLFLGFESGLNDDGSDNKNTAVGFETLKDNTEGYLNTAIGHESMKSTTTGYRNAALGNESLAFNTTGWNNTAVGYRALYSNQMGNCNTAFGSLALQRNSEGIYNTAIGNRALFNNTTGYNNLGNGYSALSLNTTGYENTANGTSALFTNDTGYWNTSNGFESMYNNTSGSNNAANGYHALFNNIDGDFNTASGFNALSNNTSGSNNTAIGYNAQVPDGTLDNQVRIGNTNVTYAGVQVAWTITSDKNWKSDIRPLPFGLDMITKLKPVDYIRKNNDHQTREMGFIAQDIQALFKELGIDDQGIITKDSNEMLSVRYNDFIAILTKAIQDQQLIIENQKNQVESLTSDLKKTKDLQEKFDKRLKEIESVLKY